MFVIITYNQFCIDVITIVEIINYLCTLKTIKNIQRNLWIYLINFIISFLSFSMCSIIYTMVIQFSFIQILSYRLLNGIIIYLRNNSKVLATTNVYGHYPNEKLCKPRHTYSYPIRIKFFSFSSIFFSFSLLSFFLLIFTFSLFVSFLLFFFALLFLFSSFHKNHRFRIYFWYQLHICYFDDIKSILHIVILYVNDYN